MGPDETNVRQRQDDTTKAAEIEDLEGKQTDRSSDPCGRSSRSKSAKNEAQDTATVPVVLGQAQPRFHNLLL